jgi:hypothetical protein
MVSRPSRQKADNGEERNIHRPSLSAAASQIGSVAPVPKAGFEQFTPHPQQASQFGKC